MAVPWVYDEQPSKYKPIIASSRVVNNVKINETVPVSTTFEWFIVFNCPAYGALRGSSGIGIIGGDNSGSFNQGGPNIGVNEINWLSFQSVYGSVAIIPGFLNELKPYGTRVDCLVEMPQATVSGSIYRGQISMAQYVSSTTTNRITFQMLASLAQMDPCVTGQIYSSRASIVNLTLLNESGT